MMAQTCYRLREALAILLQSDQSRPNRSRDPVEIENLEGRRTAPDISAR